MGVPAFYRWLSEKYPKAIQDVVEERVGLVPGSTSLRLPFPATTNGTNKSNNNNNNNNKSPNPSGLECDNLYLDMNGIIHPCAHPEHGPPPKTEVEMYDNICRTIDRLMRAIRPRQLLYLAIDGVAPRAKMNQQRARRFRSAQEARELNEIANQVRRSSSTMQPVGDEEDANHESSFTKETQENSNSDNSEGVWDSNVITPGTPFMIQLAAYIRFYIRYKLKHDVLWRDLRVIFSDASIPGEGEHKIINFIRNQRSQPSGYYNPNLVHVLHGLDADLIMLGLATHEAHFYVSRELVVFGRKSHEEMEKRQAASGFADLQKAYNAAVGDTAMTVLPENYAHTPLQRVSIPILREYLAAEFASVLATSTTTIATTPPSSYSSHHPHQQPSSSPPPALLERVIDDIVFLCFFVGNDFLPHLPSLDIRDGALDYLFNVYKRLWHTTSTTNANANNNNSGSPFHLTASGGTVLLDNVDILLAEIGSLEDYVFAMKHDNEQQEQKRRKEYQQRNNSKNNSNSKPPTVVESKAKPLGRSAKILAKQTELSELESLSSRWRDGQNSKQTSIAVSHHPKSLDNVAAARALQESLGLVGAGSNQNATATEISDVGTTAGSTTRKRSRDTENDTNEETINAAPDVSAGDNLTASATTKTITKLQGEPVEFGVVGDAQDEFDVDDDEDEDENNNVGAPEVDPEEAAKRFKALVKAEQQKKLDEHANSVVDTVRLHEAGWKDRYYSDKCKADDVRNHGGREHLFRSYVMGLCWVMKYYYDGCPSWKWYYPFHYGPFASDLKNVSRFKKDCMSFELNTPFNPVEQLMAVLPSDSARAIPKEARWLMKDPESPIIDFYPMDVPVDPNGKAMPWLWVVLLPFIDEDRLLAAMSPTMSKWEKTELLCNARGLDDGYLYVHRQNPLAKKFASVLQNGKTAANATRTKLTDLALYGCPGFSGSVRPPLSSEHYPIDEDVVVPLPPGADEIDSDSTHGMSIFCESIEVNEAVCVSFTEPHKLAHKSVLLPGAIVAAPSLTDDDKRIRRPRLNRGGGSIANMGGMSNGQIHKEGFGSMNISTYERNLAQQNGRGNEMNQTGTRAWGAMEPMAKRQYSGQGGMPYTNPSAGPQHAQPNHSQNRHQNQNLQGQLPHWQNQQRMGGTLQHFSNHPAPPYQSQQQQSNLYQSQTSYQRQSQSDNRHFHQRQARHPQQYQGQQMVQNAQGRGGYVQSNYNQNAFNHQGPALPVASQSQQQGFDFRSFNQNSGQNPYQQQRQMHGQPNGAHQANDARRSRASADVMSSLRAQLTSTLNQKRGGSGGGPPNDSR